MRDEPQHLKSDADSVGCYEACAISVFQAGGLVGCAQRLARHAAQAGTPREATDFATASILTAAAAAEAALAEFVSLQFPVFSPEMMKKFYHLGVADKYEIVKSLISGQSVLVIEQKLKRAAPPLSLGNDHPEVARLIEHRNAIAHSEPEHLRSRLVGARGDKGGAQWAADTAHAFICAIWDGSDMPQWLAEDMLIDGCRSSG